MDLHTVPRSRVNTCPGVLRLVEFGGEPQTVPEYVIATIFQQLNERNGLPVRPVHPFNPGDIVQIKQGPLQALEMIFIGSSTPGGRVQVLLELLGRLKEVQVDVELLERSTVASLVSHGLSAQRERYLRKDREIQRSA
jgi:transcription antitermination factor NusG